MRHKTYCVTTAIPKSSRLTWMQLQSLGICTEHVRPAKSAASIHNSLHRIRLCQISNRHLGNLFTAYNTYAEEMDDLNMLMIQKNGIKPQDEPMQSSTCQAYDESTLITVHLFITCACEISRLHINVEKTTFYVYQQQYSLM